MSSQAKTRVQEPVAASSPWRELYAPIAEELAQTEQFLRQIAENSSPIVREVTSHTMGVGGKRLRPALLLLCADACGPVTEQTVRLAAAVELVHSGSLLHDDVLDEAETRRGAESAWRKWGVSQAVLVGDYLAAVAYRYLAEHDDNNYLNVLAQTVGEMCEAELLSLERGDEIDEQAYLQIIGGKTAALFSASCRLGAKAADAPDDVQSELAAFGHDLGLAFQVTDDLLDLYGDAAKLGKSVGQDQSRGMRTLAVIYALENDDSGRIARLLEELSEDTDGKEARATLAAQVEQAGGRSYAEQCARDYINSAQRHLQVLSPSPSREALFGLTKQIVGRIS
ncbi:MAG: polyprenyl synthetase family protein [Armatimonadetes bacterium]|nr:polyprenyl synthetase family protein [Armatimonadota bacterium]